MAHEATLGSREWVAADRSGRGLADQDLVAAAQADPAAFAPLYRRYLRPVYGYVHARVGNRAEAEDLTSEIFVRVLRALPTDRERGRPFGAWLLAIARNTVADRRRADRAPRPLEAAGALADADGCPGERLLRRNELITLAAALDALPPAQRDVVVLKFFGQWTHRAIAELLGRSEPAAKMLLHRALARLRKTFEEGEA